MLMIPNAIISNLEQVSYIATISSAIVVAITLAFTAYQIRKSCEEFSENHKKDRFLKAIEIAKEYECIISDISYIQSVIRQDKSMVAILSKLTLSSLNDFSESELNSLFENKEELLYLTSFFRTGNINENILFAIYSLKGRGKAVGGGDSISHSQESALIKQNFYDTITGVLNKLEYISMSLNLNVADEEILFPSLHQSFLTIVKILYATIALTNKNYSDKFYTNVIKLFIKWRDRDIKNKSAEKEMEQLNSDLENEQRQIIEAKQRENQMVAKEQIHKTPTPLKK